MRETTAPCPPLGSGGGFLGLQSPLGFFVVCYIYRDSLVYAIVKNIIINIFSLVSWFAYDLLLTYILLTRFFVLFFVDLVLYFDSFHYGNKY